MSGLYTQLVSRLLFPAHEALKGHRSVAKRSQLEQSQWLPPAALAELQAANLKRFITRIYHQVPYYRELFDQHAIDPASIQSVADLSRLPLLTKALIRDNLDRLKAGDHAGLKRFNTGGSSGSPLIFYLDRERVSHDVAAKWRATRWWGVDIGDPEIVAWGSPIELTGQDRIKALRDRMLRTRLLPAFDLGEAQIERFIRQIRTLRPAMLFGYPSVYDMIARQAEAQQLDLSRLGIKVVFVTSEKLYEHQRQRIERVFGCPVANGYGGRDAGFIAHQCPAGGMHLSAEDIIVEIVSPEGKVLPAGEAGEIVVTHTATGGFPFVRYRTGDVGVLGSQRCSCGRGLPLLERIEGRSTDFVVAADGTVMHGLALIYVLREIPGIHEFKIVQKSRQLTRVEVTMQHGQLDEPVRSQIVQGLRQRLGGEVTIEVEGVERIAPEPSGKYRYVKSEVEIA